MFDAVAVAAAAAVAAVAVAASSVVLVVVVVVAAAAASFVIVVIVIVGVTPEYCCYCCFCGVSCFFLQALFSGEWQTLPCGALNGECHSIRLCFFVAFVFRNGN